MYFLDSQIKHTHPHTSVDPRSITHSHLDANSNLVHELLCSGFSPCSIQLSIFNLQLNQFTDYIPITHTNWNYHSEYRFLFIKDLEDFYFDKAER